MVIKNQALEECAPLSNFVRELVLQFLIQLSIDINLGPQYNKLMIN